MKFSVITPSYNQGVFLDTCIRSVLTQDYKNIEYVVMDGGSTDGSKDIISAYADRIAHIGTGPDEGQSDAINRGFSASTGEILCWVNSDDALLPGAISAVSEYLDMNPSCQWVAGHCQFTDVYGRKNWLCLTKPRPAEEYLRFWEGTFLPQPSVFFRRSLWNRCGPLKVKLNYSMDLDLWLRFFDYAPLHYIDRVISINRSHEATKTRTGGEDAIKEISEVLFNCGLNRGQRYSLQFIERQLRRYFVSNELDRMRTLVSYGVSELARYNLSLRERFTAIGIGARRYAGLISPLKDRKKRGPRSE